MFPRVEIDGKEIRQINIWHPVDGTWRNIFQIHKEDGEILFYTDGVLFQACPERQEDMNDISVAST